MKYQRTGARSMWRQLGSIGLILILGGAAARASTIGLSLSGLPATYTPGSTLTFEVGLTGAADLNSYNVGLDLTADKGTAGTDFYFVGSPGTTRPPDGAGSYVFDSGLGVSSPFGFCATADEDLGTNTALLSLSDFLASGETVSDTSPNTMLATVVVGTTPAAGDLTLSLDGSVLELLTPGGQPVAGYETLAANLNSSNPPPVAAAVPEPSSMLLLAIAGAGGSRLLGAAARHFVMRLPESDYLSGLPRSAPLRTLPVETDLQLCFDERRRTVKPSSSCSLRASHTFRGGAYNTT